MLGLYPDAFINAHNIAKKQTEPGIEPGTSRTAVWCVNSTLQSQLKGSIKSSYLTIAT